MRTCTLTLIALAAILAGRGVASKTETGVALETLQAPAQAARNGLVSIDVTVVDERGSPVSGLARNEFELLVDGETRPIEHFAGGGVPVLAVLLLDVSASCWAQPAILTPALEKRFWAALRPSDRVRIGLIGNGRVVPTLTLGGDRGGLQTALRLLDLPPTYTVQDKLIPSTSSVLAQVGVRETKATGARMGPSPVWDAVYGAATVLEREPGRRAIVLLTDGRATGNVHGLDETIDRALASGAPIHVVSEAEDVLIPVDASNAALVRPGVFLERMAHETGGSYVSVIEELASSRGKETLSTERISKQVGACLARALQQSQQAYRLGFTPSTLDSGMHRLEVHVKRQGLEVHAPVRFVGPAPASH